MKSSEHSFPFNDLVILCNRKVTTCKKVLMDFKNRYSVSNELQWVSNAQDVRDVKKGVLVCLKISRLTDDITDAIKMVDLSGKSYFFVSCELLHLLSIVFYQSAHHLYHTKDHD